MAECERIPVVAVAGPTASGKTALAVRLAKRYDGEVVSCDSMQIYRELSVSTAKPTEAEMQGVPHYLLDFLPPNAPFSAADYCERARACIADIHARGKTVFLCGGTGLYMQSLLENIDFTGSRANEDLRGSLRELARTQGCEAVWQRLRDVDPFGAEALHPNNLGRVIRSIELFAQTGMTAEQRQALSRSSPPQYCALVLCLDFSDRQQLYARIDARVDAMVAQGLEQEARQFFSRYGADGGTARQAIGCKEFLPYFSGACSFDEAVDAVKRETRRYAKRQCTWFRRMKDVIYLPAEDPDAAFAAACERIEVFLQKGGAHCGDTE